MPSMDLVARFIGVDAGMGGEFDRMSAKAGMTGSSLAKFGLGAAAAFGVVAVESIKTAAKFQTSMEMIHTQAGVSQKQVDSWSKSLLGMAGAVGTGPEALSEALFHIASTGARGAKALNEVRIAAEGAKVGGADLTDVTNALNATIVSGIKGAGNFGHAMGALNAIVGAGDMHMQDLADALGSGVLAVMKTFGVTLTQSGAALAVFGDNNIRGAQAATYLRQAVQSISLPSKNADKALAQIHLTAKGLEDSLAKGGLTGALTTLHDHFASSGVAANRWGDIMEQAFTKRAGVGITILLEQFGRYQLKQAEVAQGAKNFSNDWSDTTKTLSFQWSRLTADVQSLAVGLGTDLIPVAVKVIHAFIDIGGAISGTVGFFEKHKELTLGLAGALSGVLLPSLVRTSAAMLSTAWTTIAANLVAMKISVFGIAGAENEAAAGARAWESSMGPIGLGLAALGAVAGVMWEKDRAGNEKAKQAIDDYVQSLHTNTNSVVSLGTQLTGLQAKQSSFNTEIAKTPGYIQDAARSSGGYKELSSQLGTTQQQMAAVTSATEKIGAAYHLTAGQVQRLADANGIDLTGSLQSVDDGFQKVVTAANLSKSPLKDANANFQQMSQSTTSASQAITNLQTSFNDLVGNFVGLKQAQISYRNDVDATVKALAKSHDSISLNTKAGRDAATAYYSQVTAIEDVTEKTYGNSKSLSAARDAAKGMLAQLEQLPVKGPAVAKVIQGLKRDIAGMGSAALTAGKSIGSNLAIGAEEGLQAEQQHLIGVAKQTIEASLHAMRVAAAVQSPSRKTRYIGQMAGGGLILGLKDMIPTVAITAGEVAKAMFRGFNDGWHGLDASIKDAFPSKLQDTLSNFTAHLGSEMTKQQNILKKAESNYRSLAQARKQAISSLRGNIAGGSDLSGVFGTDATGNPTVAGASTFLAGQVGPLKMFAHDMQWAARHHLSPALLAQIANMGPVQGDQILKQFMTGVSSIGQANSSESLIQRYAGVAARVTVETPHEKAALAAAKHQVRLAQQGVDLQRQTNRHLERLVSHLVAHDSSVSRRGSSVTVKITGKDLIKSIREEERRSGKKVLAH